MVEADAYRAPLDLGCAYAVRKRRQKTPGREVVAPGTAAMR